MRSAYTIVLATVSLGLAVGAAAAAPATFEPACCTHANIVRASDDKGLASQLLAGPLKADDAQRSVQPPQGAKLNQGGLSALVPHDAPGVSDLTQSGSTFTARNAAIENMVSPPEEMHNALTNNLIANPGRAVAERQIYPPNAATEALTANLSSGSLPGRDQSKESMVNANLK